MYKLDRYILRQFIPSFLFGIMAFSVIYIIVDLLEKLDKFLDRDLTLAQIVTFYLYALPDIIHLIVPIAMLLASLFTIGRLDQMHELTAMRAAGNSIRRIALPLFAFGLVISCVMIYFNGWLVPQANKQKYAFERKYLGQNLAGGRSNVFLRISPTMNLTMDFFDPANNQANTISLERFDTLARVVRPAVRRTSAADFTLPSDTVHAVSITERIDAATMRYDAGKKVWVLLNGIARNLKDPNRVTATGFTERQMNFIPFTPEQLNLSQQNVAELTLSEMEAYIQQEKSGGRNVNRMTIDYYAAFAFPFSALIVILYGIPFTSTQRKSGAGVRIAITAVVSALYLIFTEVSKTLSYGTVLPPPLTAWMANILFAIVGAANLYRIERG